MYGFDKSNIPFICGSICSSIIADILVYFKPCHVKHLRVMFDCTEACDMRLWELIERHTLVPNNEVLGGIRPEKYLLMANCNEVEHKEIKYYYYGLCD